MTFWLICFGYVLVGAVAARLVRKRWKLANDYDAELRRDGAVVATLLLWPLAWVVVVIVYDPPEPLRLPRLRLRRPKATVAELERAVGIEPLDTP